MMPFVAMRMRTPAVVAGGGGWNSADASPSGGTVFALSNGSRTASALSNSSAGIRGVATQSSGVHYFEVKVDALGAGSDGLIIGASWGTIPNAWTSATAMAVFRKNGQSFYDGSNFNANGTAWSVGDVIGVVVSHTGAFVRFYRNNSLVTTITATAPGANAKPAHWTETNMGGLVTLRTKLSEFSYAVPAGATAWE